MWLFSDQCVYIRHIRNKLVIIRVHVDDMIILASDNEAMAEFKQEFGQKFDILDLGELKQIVGFEVQQDLKKGTIHLTQNQYVGKILDRFELFKSTPVKMPLDLNVKLAKTPEGEHHKIPQYAAAIGSLMYAAIGTQTDIAYAVQHLSQFTSNLSPVHWSAIKRVFWYLNGTHEYGITYGGGNIVPILEGYSNVDWGNSNFYCKSISGYIFLFRNVPISWASSHKKCTVAVSAMEAEYVAASLATCEAIWLQTLLMEIGLLQNKPTQLNINNQSAIEFSKNQGSHLKSKHIDTQHHFVCERLSNNFIIIKHCASEDNLADVFTKALPHPAHKKFTSRIGMNSELRRSVG